MTEKAKDKEVTKTKPRYFKEQFDDEEVHLVFRKHPIVMRKGLILAAVGMLVGPLFTLVLTYAHKTNPPTITFFFGSLFFSFILSCILIFPWWVRWYFSIYIMTNQRFIQQSRSLLQINFVDISLDQIQMINYQIIGLEETMLHFGTITVQTYVGDLVIKDVHHPEHVQKKMVHILRQMGVHPSQRPYQGNESKVGEE
ncbi:MAG TPA: hypothetical protein VFB03_03850 [Candidatus Saccharimonadales bacterium]|nr:hypothetical protein [Candidatus Saccharimonadales bacterium]